MGRVTQDVTIFDETNDYSMLIDSSGRITVNQGLTASNANAWVTKITDGVDTVGVATDLSGGKRLMVDAYVGGGTALHTIIDDSKNPTLFQDSIHPDRYLRTKSFGSPMLSENFSGANFDLAKWTVITTSGGTYVQQNAFLQLDTTTTSGSKAEIITKGYWEFFSASTQAIDMAVRFANSQPTNNYKLWGAGYAENDGVFFKLVGASLYASMRFNGTETLYDITAYRPSDGNIHEYKIVYRDNRAVWYIDDFAVYVKDATTLDLFRYTQMKAISENENTGTSSGASTLYLHHVSLTDDSTSQVVQGKSNLGLRVTNELLIDASFPVYNSGNWRTLFTYMVPGPNIVELMGFRSAGGSGQLRSRICARLTMGTWISSVFTAGSSYVQPRFGSKLEIFFPTGTGAQDTTVTITYINSDGTAGRTATLSVIKNSAANSRFDVPLQSGDIGFIQVTNASDTRGNNFTILGITELARHHHNTADVMSESIFAKESVMLSGLDYIDMDVWANNTNTYTRFLSAIFTIS